MAKITKRVNEMSMTKIAAIFADSEVYDHKEVTVGGWARTIRDMKNFGFVELNDGCLLYTSSADLESTAGFRRAVFRLGCVGEATLQNCKVAGKIVSQFDGGADETRL